MIYKTIALLLLIITLSGCNNAEEVLPDIEVEDVLPEVEESNSYHELLMSYVFINVLDTSKVILPSSIMGEDITWFNNDKEVNTLTGGNITYYLTAYIGNESKSFNIEFNNNKVTHIYQQDLKFYYHFISDNRKMGTSMNPTKIVFHNTANTASALNEVKYLNSSSNTSSTSFHFAVDDIGIYQAIPTNIYAHHAGDLFVNQRSIGIEIAKSLLSDTSIKDKAINNGQRLIRLLQMQYNVDELLTHKDVTNKHCPHDIIDRYGLNRFYSELKNMYK